MPVPLATSALVSSLISAIIQSSDEAALQSRMEADLVRPLPVAARRGEMQPPMQGEVIINGERLYLSRGAQIRNPDNRIVMPSTIQEPATVRYITDSTGAVSRVWMLTPAEAALPDPDPQ